MLPPEHEPAAQAASPEQLGNVLAVGAHPDDESMSHGALLATIANRTPASLFVLTASLGEASTKGKDIAENGGRLEEVEKAYDIWGVAEGPQHRHYPELEDTRLHLPENILKLAGVMVEIIEENDVDTLVTPGWAGFDGHSDHIGVHIAAVLAAHRANRNVRVLGLSTRTNGNVEVPVDEGLKRKALSSHESQFTDGLDNVIQTHLIYSQLMQVEAYDYMDSPADLARAEQYLVEPLEQHIS